MRSIEIFSGLARVTVSPDLGAGLTGYDVIRDGVALPILRRVDPQTAHPFALSSILLVPFSGRVSGGGFTFDGIRHAMDADMPAERLPIHGSGFLKAWTVTDRRDDAVTLALQAAQPGPFRYEARITYALQGAALVMTMEVVNRAAMRLPYGAGFHPWFVRDGETRLQAAATTAWREDAHHLPAGSGPVADDPQMDFAKAKCLPDRWINSWFSGWDGRARIDWPQRRLWLDIEASTTLSSYVLFSPSGDSDFFCFEPVSHPVDALNLAGDLPGAAERLGLAVLMPGQAMTVSVTLRPGPTAVMAASGLLPGEPA